MSRELKIADDIINDDSDCYVVAEIGHNHQGSVQMAKELFRAAAECGANAVKLQKRDNRALYTEDLFSKPYDHENSFGTTYGNHREVLEFGRDEYLELQQYAKDLGITFFATAFDFYSADFLEDMGMPAFKIASGDLKNIPLLKHVASFGKPMIVSTGGANMEDIERAYDSVMPINRQLCIMQCTSGYPAAYEELNLRTIASFCDRFQDIVIGFSSHDSGIAMALVGYIMGARIIEKHFTLNRAMKGTDHAFSLERSGLRRLVRDLKRSRIALGDGIKQPFPSETAPMYKMGKKLVLARELPVGSVLTESDIAIKSPNDGLPPYRIDEVIGKQTLRKMGKDETISFSDLAAPA